MEEINCDYCSETIERYPSQITENNFCSHKCHNLWKTGDNNQSWSGGMSKTTCLVCSNEFQYYESARSGKYCSRKCKSIDEQKEEFRKNRHFYNRTKWYNKRKEIKERDNYTCVWCGQSEDCDLHVHHIRPISMGGDKYSNNNLITLCNRCHGWAHKALTD